MKKIIRIVLMTIIFLLLIGIGYTAGIVTSLTQETDSSLKDVLDINLSNYYSDKNTQPFPSTEYLNIEPQSWDFIRAIQEQQAIIIQQNNTISDMKKALCEIKPELEICK